LEVTGAGATSYSYDGENRMLTTDWPTGAITTNTYQGYDSLRRTLQATGSTPTTFVWAGRDYLEERS
jgi:hypothetical protein